MWPRAAPKPPRERGIPMKSGVRQVEETSTKPLQAKGKPISRPLPTAGKGVGIPYTDGFSSKKVRASVKRHHHPSLSAARRAKDGDLRSLGGGGHVTVRATDGRPFPAHPCFAFDRPLCKTGSLLHCLPGRGFFRFPFLRQHDTSKPMFSFMDQCLGSTCSKQSCIPPDRRRDGQLGREAPTSRVAEGFVHSMACAKGNG